jgi:alcohol dehydrogenase class IV
MPENVAGAHLMAGMASSSSGVRNVHCFWHVLAWASGILDRLVERGFTTRRTI